MTALKPCPCCGGKPWLDVPTDPRMAMKGCAVECTACGLRTGRDYPNGDCEATAVDAWNTRVNTKK